MADESSNSVKMGVIICKHCGVIVDTVYTEKVVTFYSHCGSKPCVDLHMNAARKAEETVE